MKFTSLLAVAAPAVIVGFGLGWSLHPPSITIDGHLAPSAALPEPGPRATRIDLAQEELSPTRSAFEPQRTVESSPRTPLEESEGEDEDEELFSAALLEHARQGIADGWRSRRSDQPTEAEIGAGIDKFEEATLSLPLGIGIQLANQRSAEELALEDARTGGVMMTLKRLEDGGEGPLIGLVQDRATFNQFFVSEHSAGAIDGAAVLTQEALQKREPVKDGSTLTFTAGVFELHDFGRYWRDHFPRDMTIRGAGKTSTLLVLSSSISSYDTVRNLTFENCSLHANNHKFLRVQGPPMSLTLRNMRITGWDNGAGGSSLIATSGLALRAISSEFLGGYGRSPQHCSLFDVRSNALLARFENCTIARTEVFDGTRAGATLVFSACRIEDAMDWNPEVPSHVLLDGTSLTWMDPALRSDPPKLDLNDLFPGWNQALGR